MTEVIGNIINIIFKAVRNLRIRLHIKTLLGVGFCMPGVIILTVSITQPASPLLIISQPQPQTDCYGNHVEFLVAITGSEGIVYYQWQERPPGGDFSDISGATGPLLSIDNIGVNSQNVNGTVYRVLIMDDNGTISSDPALLSINSIISLTPIVVNSTVCNGGSITYSVFTEGNVFNNGYRWSWNNGSGWTFISDGGAYSGTTSSQLTISNATPAQNGSYRVSVTFSTLNQPPGDPSCIETSFTRERNIVVREPLLPPEVYNSEQICYGKVPSILTATAVSGGSGPIYSYQWQSSTDGAFWIDIPGANLLSYSPHALTSNTFYRITTTDVGIPRCGTVYSGAVLITVYPLPTTSSIYHN